MNRVPDLNQLKLCIAEKRMTIDELSEKSGIPRLPLLRLLEGKQEFRASEIFAITEALEMSDARKIMIFCRDSSNGYQE